jgi:hypothetical protein
MSISQTQIEKIKLVHKTIKALAKIQDNFFQELVQELNLPKNHYAAVDWLFDYCYNEKSPDSVEYFIERINKAIKEGEVS